MTRVKVGPAPPDRKTLDVEIARLRGLDLGELQARWHTVFRRRPVPHLPRHLLFRVLAYRFQAEHLGDPRALKFLFPLIERYLESPEGGQHLEEMLAEDQAILATFLKKRVGTSRN
jgi:hypothetical protein